jgi:hypothetical protein
VCPEEESAMALRQVAAGTVVEDVSYKVKVSLATHFRCRNLRGGA